MKEESQLLTGKPSVPCRCWPIEGTELAPFWRFSGVNRTESVAVPFPPIRTEVLLLIGVVIDSRSV
jgi:hypothetical protein